MADIMSHQESDQIFLDLAYFCPNEFSLNWHPGRFSLKVVMYVTCLSVHVWKPRFPVDLRLLVKERIAYIGIPLDVIGFWLIQ